MSVIFIENYRGKDIFYSPLSEKFFADIDDGKEKNLIHLVRKDIDYYIKNNQSFKPFYAFDESSFHGIYNNDKKILKVIGLRKDNALQCEDNNQISNYDLEQGGRYNKECRWYILSEDKREYCLSSIEKEEGKIKELETKIKEHRGKISKFVDELKGENLADFRRRLLGENKQY